MNKSSLIIRGTSNDGTIVIHNFATSPFFNMFQGKDRK